MPTATLLHENLGGYAGPANCYELSAPLTDHTQHTANSHVVVFTVEGIGAPETIIVPARPDGSATVMNRLPGSVVGVANHAAALWAAGGFEHGEGYDIVIPEPEPEPEPEPIAEEPAP